MNYKIIVLQIIKENPDLGMHKLDRLFHSKVDFSIFLDSHNKWIEEWQLAEVEDYANENWICII